MDRRPQWAEGVSAMRYRVEDRSRSAFSEQYSVVDETGYPVRTFTDVDAAWSYAAIMTGEPLARLQYRGRTQKVVHVYGLTADHDGRDALNIALPVAGESRSSIFGSRVIRHGSRAIVTLNTD